MKTLPVCSLLCLALLLSAGNMSTAAARAAGHISSPAAPPVLNGCQIFPADNIWNAPVDWLGVHPNSAAIIQSIGANETLHPDFGAGLWEGYPIGIPYNVVSGSQATVSVDFYYPTESDPGPYPIPPAPKIEGGSDHHILILDQDNCQLYEIYDAWYDAEDGWQGGSGAIFNLSTNSLRPAGWTSADAAGLPILPGLVRYDEVAAGEITHALRFTVQNSRSSYIWPARHEASELTGSQYPPMGLRLRMRADYNISAFDPQVQVILRALKKYGMIVADNGSDWYISGVPDERWDNDILVPAFHSIPGSAFEVVDITPLLIDTETAAVRLYPYRHYLPITRK